MRRIALAIVLLVWGIPFIVSAQDADRFEVITVENAQNLVELRTWNDTNEAFSRSTAAFSPDGSELALALNNGQIEFVSTETLDTVRIIDGIETEAEWLNYSFDGSELLLSNQTGVYALVDIETGEILAVSNTINEGMFFSPTPDVRKFVLSSYFEGGVSVYDTITGQELFSLADTNYWGVSYDGTLLATRNDNLIVQIWDIESGEIVFEIVPPGDNVATDDLYGAGFTPDGLVWVNYPQYTQVDNQASWYSPIQFWDISTGEIVFELEGADYFTSLQFDPSNTYILTWGLNPQSFSNLCTIWDMSSLDTIPCYAGGNDWTTFSPNSHLIAINSGTSSNVYIRQIDCDCPEIIQLETDPTWFVEFSPDGRFLVTIDSAIHLWGVSAAEE